MSTPSLSSPAGDLALLADGSLALRVEPAAESLVRSWIPRIPPGTGPAPDAARIHVAVGRPEAHRPPDEPPAIQVLGVDGWLAGADRAMLRASDGTLHGTVDLERLRARIVLDDAADPDSVALHASSGLTIAAGLLLNRQGRALLHAGAFVAPSGAAWLLVGDSQSGKTSTCANLIRAGWDYLADDQVVIRRSDDPGRLVVEGWPGLFNLDVGFGRGTSEGRRSAVDAGQLGRGTWRRAAPLGGLLFPRVEADRTTSLEAITPARALAGLIRQSPWLLADVCAAGDVLGMMKGVAAYPARGLRLGRDAYRDPATLVACLEDVLSL